MKRTVPLVWAVVLAAGASCAYFNTLFNAKQLYKRAERLRLESEAEELPGAADELYGQVVRKAAKVLKFYPTHGCVDEALLVMGMAFYRQGEYAKALRKFKELTVQYPGSDFAAAGFLGMGLVFYAQHDYGKAADVFGRLLEGDGIENTKSVRDDALFMMALLSRDRDGDCDRAVTTFRRVIDEFGRSEHRQTAQFRIAECLFSQGKYAEAYDEYRKAAKYRYIKTMAYRSRYRMGECLLEQGRADEALAWYGDLLKNEKYETHYPELKLQTARCHRRAGRPEAALGAYRDVTENHGQSPEAAYAHSAMGMLYRDRLKDYAKAEEAFGKAAAAFTDEALKQDAERDKKTIETYNFLTKEIFKTGDDSTSVAPRMKLAELYLFDFGRPDSALAQYRLIAETFPGHREAPRAAYAAAWVVEHRLDDPERAGAMYEEVLSGWPDAAFADSVRLQLGRRLQGRDDARRARERFLRAEELRLDGAQPPAGIADAYLAVADSFPAAPTAPRALYNAAWLYDYQTGDTARARGLYRRIKDEYGTTPYGGKAALKLAARPALSDSAAAAEDAARKEAEKESMKKRLEELDGREPLPEDEKEDLRSRLRQRRRQKAGAVAADSTVPVSADPALADSAAGEERP